MTFYPASLTRLLHKTRLFHPRPRPHPHSSSAPATGHSATRSSACLCPCSSLHCLSKKRIASSRPCSSHLAPLIRRCVSPSACTRWHSPSQSLDLILSNTLDIAGHHWTPLDTTTHHYSPHKTLAAVGRRTHLPLGSPLASGIHPQATSRLPTRLSEPCTP